MAIRMLAATLVMTLNVALARKTYIVKDKVNSGSIVVSQPRVRTYDCSWCFFKDANNDFCVSGDINWKLSSKTEKYNQEATQLAVEPHYKHTFSYETEQSGAWFSQFNLKKFFWNSLTYTLSSFIAGLRFEMYYWYLDQAFCFNLASYINPVSFTVTSATKLEQCSKTIVKCLDNWDQLTNVDELLIGECVLSSSEDVAIYDYKAVENLYTKYWLGADAYYANYCWPGPSPFYSKFEEFPDNPFWAITQMYSSLTGAFTVARRGLEYNAKAFAAPVVRNTWD
jgi:hypothetical protein